ncbi:MAG: hypothetical protein JRJ45_07970 [Deltaproteobacteria bacterium]|nr:hypothetical protein [Deltaproteobacteria bacterium]
MNNRQKKEKSYMLGSILFVDSIKNIVGGLIKTGGLRAAFSFSLIHLYFEVNFHCLADLLSAVSA